MRNILILIFVPALFSCGLTKTAKSDITMGRKVADSLEIEIRIGNCISLKEMNVLGLHLKNKSHSTLTIHTGDIVLQSISDSDGHKLMPLRLIEYGPKVSYTIELTAGAEKEISDTTSDFSNYKLKTGQPFYVSAGCNSTRKTSPDFKEPLTKFYLCN